MDKQYVVSLSNEVPSLKRNETLMCVTTCMNLGVFTLISQSQKDTDCTMH